MPRALKVFRTPIGFHDAYVAAASQKDALAAWGSDANLFARGVAEVVTDPALTAEPLAAPGTVIKRLRGSAEDHFDALPKATARAAKPAKSTPERPAKPKAVVPRPSRAELDEAEAALAEAETRATAAHDDLRARETALARERAALDQAQAKERDTLTRAEREAHARYTAALTKWRDATG